jgi:carboxylate-amine ligase
VSTPYRLFEAVGVELEYMIADRASLDVRPIADKLLLQAALEAGSSLDGDQPTDFEFEGAVWSNELALHVIEMKTEEPARTLMGLASTFDESVERINTLLAPMHARLLPGGMHPWMNPDKEMVLWPHNYSEVYSTFDRIFGCKGHGWANLQSVHINLPFRGDEEFAHLHAAIRMLLPILPALAASSPIMDGRATGLMDNRLEVYRTNARKLPSMTGRVVPEAVFTESDYDRQIFQRIFADLQPLDPEGVLRHEWANARGAIARFSRGSIEIRVLDVQECPRADLAMVALIVQTLKDVVRERWLPLDKQKQWSVDRLEPIFLECVKHADEAVITDTDYLKAWGYTGPVDRPATARDLWRHIEAAASDHLTPAERECLNVILNEGTLARRLTKALGPNPDRAAMQGVYDRLAHCLSDGKMFA